MDGFEVVRSYYRKRMALNGKGARENLWQEPHRQIVRFEQFTQMLDLRNKRIVDVGGGYGDFYFWLLKKGMAPSGYVCVELLNEHCEVARERLPKVCDVLEGDFLKVDVPPADVFVLSGTLNVHFDGWLESAKMVLDKMWGLATEAIAVTIRSPHSEFGDIPHKEKQLRDLNPAFWCTYAHERTTKYILNHGYMNNDYMIAMWKP